MSGFNYHFHDTGINKSVSVFYKVVRYGSYLKVEVYKVGSDMYSI